MVAPLVRTTIGDGPDYISSALMIWAGEQGIALNHTQPGKPQQSAYVVHYNRTFRHEWLDLSIFETIAEVQQITADWLWTRNNQRPAMGIGGMTPAQQRWLAEVCVQTPSKRGE